MNPRTFFIVDDDTMLNEMLTDYLHEQFPFVRIKAFHTGEECLAHLSDRPDLVILDYYLNPREKDAANGLDILKEVKAWRKDMPVIMLSAQKHYAVAAKSISYGATHYVVKSEDAFREVRDIIESSF